jgi:hypothetical protein
MVHALPREAHNLLSVWNMNYRDQLRNTKPTEGAESGCACLEPGHTTMWLLGASTISYYQEMAAHEALTSSGPHEGAEHLSVNTILPHPLRSSITALRSFFGIAILVGSCALSATSLVVAADLFGKATKGSGADQKPDTVLAP